MQALLGEKQGTILAKAQAANAAALKPKLAAGKQKLLQLLNVRFSTQC